MAAMKPRTGDGPMEVTKEGRGIVMRVPVDGGGRLVVELNAEEAAELLGCLKASGGLENAFSTFNHRGISAAKHMVGIDDYVDSPTCQFCFSKLGVGGGNRHYGCMIIFFTEALAELLDVHTVLVLRMNHNAVCASCNISESAIQCIFNRFAGNQ